MTAGQIDIGDILGPLTNGPMLGTHRRRMDEIMRHFHRAGLSLAVCADERHMDRKLVTLKGYARRLKLAFPDYVPLALRPPKPSKEKKGRKRT